MVAYTGSSTSNFFLTLENPYDIDNLKEAANEEMKDDKETKDDDEDTGMEVDENDEKSNVENNDQETLENDTDENREKEEEMDTSEQDGKPNEQLGFNPEVNLHEKSNFFHNHSHVTSKNL